MQDLIAMIKKMDGLPSNGDRSHVTLSKKRARWLGTPARWLLVFSIVAVPVAGLLPAFAPKIGRSWASTPSGSDNEASSDVIVANAMERCVGCHTFGSDFSKFTPDELYNVFRHGAMQEMVTGLDDGTLRMISQSIGDVDAAKSRPSNGGAVMCASTAPLDPTAASWPGWSPDGNNGRFVNTSLAAGGLAKAEVKWTFGFPQTRLFEGDNEPVAIANGRAYVGGANGWFYALDTKSGCARWAQPVKGWVRGGAAVSDHVVVVGDNNGWVYGFNEEDGRLLWSHLADQQVNARVTATVTIANGRAYVPISSMEQGISIEAFKYLPCCTFSGSVTAFDIRSGKLLWNTKMIDQPIRPLGKGPGGMNAYGPAGAAIWATPTADLKRGVLYVGTSHQITGAPQPGAHAIVALDLETGKKRWVANFLKEANSGVLAHPGEVATGRDGDFNTAPILVKRRDGKEILLVGNKESYIYALDPDKDGQVIWRSKVGLGGSLGGISYGLATDGELVFAPLFDLALSPDHGATSTRDRVSTIVAADLFTGQVVWRTAFPRGTCKGKAESCQSAFYGPATVVGNVVFAGGADGVIRGYDKRSGKFVWSYDAVKSHKTVNGVAGQGGSYSMGGAVFAGDSLYLNTGSPGAGIPGNALIVLKIPSQKK